MNVQNFCVGGGRFFIRRALSLRSPVVIFNFLGHMSRTVNVITR